MTFTTVLISKCVLKISCCFGIKFSTSITLEGWARGFTRLRVCLYTVQRRRILIGQTFSTYFYDHLGSFKSITRGNFLSRLLYRCRRSQIHRYIEPRRNLRLLYLSLIIRGHFFERKELDAGSQIAHVLKTYHKDTYTLKPSKKVFDSALSLRI